MQFARNICCNQHDDVTVGEKKEICEDLGCIYEKCAWKRDGYDDDDSKTSWKNDGYDEDYEDEQYKYKNDYDDDNYQKNKYNVEDYYNSNYQKNKYDSYNDYYNDNNYQKNKYDSKNEYEEDKCTADEREECCTANEKKQVQVCESLGCNVRKVRMVKLGLSPSIISSSFV